MPLSRPGIPATRKRTRSNTSALACGLAGLLFAAPALAHEYWLAPARYRAAAGETNSVSAFVGTGFSGEPRPYATTRSLRFILKAAQTVDLLPVAVNGQLTFATFEMPDGGGALIAYQSNFATIELPAAEFDAYLKLEGLAGPLAARAKFGSAAGAGPGADAARGRRALKPVGLPIEIVPLADPGAGTTLPVRVLWRGRPLAGALVRAWNAPLDSAWTPRDAATRDSVGPVSQMVTDARGEAHLEMGAAGEWMIAAVHMIPCAERREADWESWWASFTFARGTIRP